MRALVIYTLLRERAPNLGIAKVAPDALRHVIRQAVGVGLGRVDKEGGVQNAAIGEEGHGKVRRELVVKVLVARDAGHGDAQARGHVHANHQLQQRLPQGVEIDRQPDVVLQGAVVKLGPLVVEVLYQELRRLVVPVPHQSVKVGRGQGGGHPKPPGGLEVRLLEAKLAPGYRGVGVQGHQAKVGQDGPPERHRVRPQHHEDVGALDVQVADPAPGVQEHHGAGQVCEAVVEGRRDGGGGRAQGRQLADVLAEVHVVRGEHDLALLQREPERGDKAADVVGAAAAKSALPHEQGRDELHGKPLLFPDGLHGELVFANQLHLAVPPRAPEAAGPGDLQGRVAEGGVDGEHGDA